MRKIGRAGFFIACMACALAVPAQTDSGGPFEAEFAAGSEALRANAYANAEQHLKSALQILASASADDPRVLKTLTGLTTALRAQRKYADAERVLERRMAARRQPVNPVDAAKDLRELGQVAFAQSKYAAAQDYFQREAEILQRRFGIEYPALATAYLDAAAAAHAVNKGAEAEQLVAKATAILDRDSMGDHAQSYRVAGDICSARQKWADAEQAYTKGLETIERVAGPEHIDTAPLLEGLAIAHRETGNPLKAEAALLRLLSVKTTSFGSAHAAIAPLLETLASVYRQARRYEEAASAFERAHEIRRSLGDQTGAVWTLAQLADVYVRMGKLAETEPLNRQLFVQREQDLLTMVRQYAANQTALSRFEDADVLYGLALQIYDRSFPQVKNSKLAKSAPKTSAPPELLVQTLEQRAQVLRKLNRKKDASRLEKQARPLRETLQARDSLTLNNGKPQVAGAL